MALLDQFCAKGNNKAKAALFLAIEQKLAFLSCSFVALHQAKGRHQKITLDAARASTPVRDYLDSVLPGLANFSIHRIAELTPIAWAARI